MLTHSTKQRNHKHPIKSQIHAAAINKTKVNYWINQGVLKELKQKTQKEVYWARRLFHLLGYPKKIKIEKPSEVDIIKDDLSIYVLSRHRESVLSVNLDQQRIPCKNKGKTPLDTSMIRK